MSCRLKRAALSVMVAGFALAFAAAADAQSYSSAAGGGGADAQRANHLNRDRWARSESSSPPAKHDEDSHESHDTDNHAATSGPHKGELNGKLHMGDWG